jgi:hypothetical protein
MFIQNQLTLWSASKSFGCLGLLQYAYYISGNTCMNLFVPSQQILIFCTNFCTNSLSGQTPHNTFNSRFTILEEIIQSFMKSYFQNLKLLDMGFLLIYFIFFVLLLQSRLLALISTLTLICTHWPTFQIPGAEHDLHD